MSRKISGITSCGLLLALLFVGCQHDEVVPPYVDATVVINSDILFIDPEPDPFTTAPWWGPVSIDIDQDSIADIELRVLYATDSTIPWLEPLWGTQVASIDTRFMISIGTLDGGYSPILAGDAIDSSLAWWSVATLHNEMPGGGLIGFWTPPHEGFIGVQRIFGDTVNYGWISVRTGLDHIVYQNSAFERIPDQYIIAGDVGP